MDINVGFLCGVDEAGRGPLAGSVVAAAVILDPKKPINGLKDSKKLSRLQRESLYLQIIKNSYGYHIASANHQEIDEINILQATMLAMSRAINGLINKTGFIPELTQIDGNRCPKLNIPMEAIVKGDSKIAAISAASILAKVTRDQDMDSLHQQYPMYGFNQHMGYPTVEHLENLEKYGPCESHRKSFGPVKKLLQRPLI